MMENQTRRTDEDDVYDTPPTSLEHTTGPSASTTDTAAFKNATEAAGTAELSEEDAEEVKATPEGVLGHMAPKCSRFTQRFFSFKDEPLENKQLSTYHQQESSTVANRRAAWASHTGKGVLCFSKQANDQATPMGIFNLADVSGVTKVGSEEFLFKVGGQEHTFRASSTAERDSWVDAIEAKATKAKTLNDAITSSESYKAELEKLSNPAVEGRKGGPRRALGAPQADPINPTGPTIRPVEEAIDTFGRVDVSEGSRSLTTVADASDRPRADSSTVGPRGNRHEGPFPPNSVLAGDNTALNPAANVSGGNGRPAANNAGTHPEDDRQVDPSPAAVGIVDDNNVPLVPLGGNGQTINGTGPARPLGNRVVRVFTSGNKRVKILKFAGGVAISGSVSAVFGVVIRAVSHREDIAWIAAGVAAVVIGIGLAVADSRSGAGAPRHQVAEQV
ncbi:hypothetical protein N7523_005897 [Penicillium sp. IBT 18751x]|nr:hypothetical protein N7523_005897 [Penicillium sp. IBT 18751x]